MNKRLWLLGAIVLIGAGIGVAFAWWSQSANRLPPAPSIEGAPASFRIVVEKQIELPAGVRTKFVRAVLQVSSGTVATAARDYLNQKAEAGLLSDLYELFTTRGRVLAVGAALAGRLERIPPEIIKMMTPWKEAKLLGSARGMIVYQVR